MDAFIIERLKREKEKEEQEWQPAYLPLEIEESREPAIEEKKKEPNRQIVIRF